MKGADLGGRDGRLVVDLNFAYPPSCTYDPLWSCPLAPEGNRVTASVEAGEQPGRAAMPNGVLEERQPGRHRQAGGWLGGAGQLRSAGAAPPTVARGSLDDVGVGGHDRQVHVVGCGGSDISAEQLRTDRTRSGTNDCDTTALNCVKSSGAVVAWAGDVSGDVRHGVTSVFLRASSPGAGPVSLRL